MLALFLGVWLFLHLATWWFYSWVWGNPLRLRFFWAATAALLWARRLPAWERHSPDQAEPDRGSGPFPWWRFW